MQGTWTGPRAPAPAPAREERIPAADGAATVRLARCLSRHLAELESPERRRLVVMCIGTDRSTGDALGPLVGSLLIEQGLCEGGAPGGAAAWAPPLQRVAVYGTLDRPVHAANLEEVLSRATRGGEHSLVLAVDACLGRLDNVGSIAVGRGPLRPGAGVNKNLTQVGDLYITGTVNVGGFMEYLVLQNTRLNLVVSMARVIAAGVLLALEAGNAAVDEGPRTAPLVGGVRLAAACRASAPPVVEAVDPA
ncbi:MAG: spore protease YyaC [Acetobacteraceae bacterium]|nr:spore protease YyaC [Acetobacteraceae bacterium]